MLTLSRYCFLILLVTIAALCWVHQQVELVTTSYKMAQRERELMELQWTHSRLQYQILTLESPKQLDQRLNQVDRRLTFTEPTRIVKVQLPSELTEKTDLVKRRGTPFLEFLVRSAEAKPASK